MTFAAGLAAAPGQHAAGVAPARPMIVLSSPVSDVVREISDQATGARWILERDPAAPGGPGRLVRIATGEERSPQAANGLSRSETALQPRVIRTGDRVVVEEHTAVMDAQLEGVALSGARSGASLRVRLKVGGKVVSAVALGPGRVAITPLTGARP